MDLTRLARSFSLNDHATFMRCQQGSTSYDPRARPAANLLVTVTFALQLIKGLAEPLICGYQRMECLSFARSGNKNSLTEKRVSCTDFEGLVDQGKSTFIQRRNYRFRNMISLSQLLRERFMAFSIFLVPNLGVWHCPLFTHSRVVTACALPVTSIQLKCTLKA